VVTDPVLDYLSPREMDTGPVSQTSTVFWHWTFVRDADDIAWAVLDRKNASVNTLSEEVLEEFDTLLGQVENQLPKALVLRSGKKEGFLAGADITEFRGVEDEEAIRERIVRAHAVVDRLEALTIPTIAVMHGYAMGGGLEIALACTHRIAVEGTRFGFPEVKLGLHPGLGGTARLTRQIDPLQAMTFMLTGKTIHDRKAQALGLIDVLVPERHVRAAVRAAARREMKTGGQQILQHLKEARPVRRIAARQMRAEAEKTAPSMHYPAPYALIDLWVAHGGDFHALKEAEITSFAHLMAGETAQNLIRVFFLREKLKQIGEGEAGISHVHVVGAGTMGGDIAAWCAWQGFRTTLGDVKAESIGQAVKRAAELFEKMGRDDAPRVREALDRLIPDLAGHGIARADLVIEAAPEKIDLKRELYAEIEPRMKRDAILATNTSSIAIDKLADGLQRPERFVGIHFFNPVSRLDLAEVIGAPAVDRAVEDRARAFVGAINKLPAPANAVPGFIVNRVLTPYLVEAMILCDEGVPRDTIDRAARDFGMPMGPLELADRVGLDIGLAVAKTLKTELGWALPDAPAWLQEKVEAGHLGRKSGQGIYRWKDGEPIRDDNAPAPPPDLADRLMLPMLNQAVAVLREGVTNDADVVDAAMIFAAGFAPFTGGPLHYARARGIGDVRRALADLTRKHGQRFRPDPG